MYTQLICIAKHDYLLLKHAKLYNVQ